MNRRNIVWLAPLILLVTFPLWKIPVGSFLSPRGEAKVAKQEDTVQPTHSYSMNDLTMYQYDGERKNAVIKSDRAYSSDDPDILLFDKVDADIFDQKGDLSIVTSEQGEYNQKTEILTLTTDVVATKPSTEQQLLTDELQYNSVTEIAHSPIFTTIITPDATIKGGNFTYEMKTGTYTMEKRVNTVLQSGDVQL